jgi:hypothetical protein
MFFAQNNISLNRRFKIQLNIINKTRFLNMFCIKISFTKSLTTMLTKFPVIDTDLSSN